jgi:hypothetical protein
VRRCWSFGRDHRRDHQHRRRRTNVSEDLAVRFAYLLPVTHIGDEHSRANDILEAGAGLLQHSADVLQRLYRLGIDISHADNLAVGSSRNGTRHRDEGSNLHRS